MRYILIGILATLFSVNCGGSAPPAESSADAEEGDNPSAATTNAEEPSADAVSENEGENTFKVNQGTGNAKDASGDSKSKLYASPTETVVQFIVVDRGNEGAPMPGIVISLTGPDGKTYYTGETDETGFAEVLVPKGQKYDLVYLSLGRKNINAQVPIPDKPNQTIKLTLRYKKVRPPTPQVPRASKAEPGFVLEGIEFDTGKATIRPGSFERLESVLEYMTHKKSARIEISGHTDN
jgi:flagellar motor protein MotB